MHNPPTGTVTYLFTDIEGSTQLWERYPHEARVALARHDAIVEAIVEQHDGSLVRPRGEGDSRFAVFSRATDGVAAAVTMQQALHAERWPTPVALRVRMALHTGEADLREGDFYGTAVNRCARLRSAAHGGQTLLSRTTYDLIREALPVGIQVRDLGQHLLRDLQQPEHIFQLLIPGVPAEFPPLKTLDAHLNNLPVQSTPLVGREKEIEVLKRLVQGEPDEPDSDTAKAAETARLATLTGPGGTGKTRLALQVAAELIDHFQDGVYFVSLAHITDPTLVAPAIAQTLGVRQVASGEMVDALGDYLSDKRLLLLLDNFEQVVEAAPVVVAKLLATAPHLKVLVTSREVLHVSGEQEFPVPPLGVPDPKHLPLTSRGLPSLEALSKYGAVALFIQRARLVKPDFEVTNDNAPAVAEICYRLDGLPLAIELAAARIRLLTPQALLARLGSRLRLLTTGARDLPERQQTLRSTIQWSYDLLQPGEQRLFRRMSVFVGGAALEAIEAVCNADGAPEVDVLDGVASLVDKSLVWHVIGGTATTSAREGEPRYSMLETIREYATELLQTTDPAEGEELYRQHTLYYLALAEQGWEGIRSPQQELWLDRLEMEFANLQAVMQRAIERGDAQTEVRLGSALREFWYMRGYDNEGYKWLREALRLPGAVVRNQARAEALMDVAVLGQFQDDLPAAGAYAQEGIAIFRDLKPEERGDLGLALAEYGLIMAFLGEHEAGRGAAEEGISLLRQTENKWGLSVALFLRGLIANAKGDFASARATLEESMALSRETGNTWFLSQALNSLGDVSRIKGDFARAKELYEESLSLFRRLNTRPNIPASLHNLGHVAQAQGRVEDAKQLFIEALRLHLSQRNRVGIAECLTGLAGVAGAEKHPESAARLFGAAEALRELLDARVWPAERVDYERNLSRARAQLAGDPAKEAAWQKSWQEGRAMSMEEAIEYALKNSVGKQP